MPHDIQGIHHITAISGPPQENLDFFSKFLGLRLVKKTVNFDDPGTYHLYYGDEAGSPGSILTFFPWENAFPGKVGVGMVSHTAFLVPRASIDFWLGRFESNNIEFEGPLQRMDEVVLSFAAPDGLLLELVARDEHGAAAGWGGGTIDSEHAILGFQGASLSVRDASLLEKLFVEDFGYESVGSEGDRTRLRAKGDAIGRFVDLVVDPERTPNRSGTGTIHHIAFRARDDQDQLEIRENLLSLGFRVTGVLDRNYFRSIYFREPGGILFEIATDAPGFAVDEKPDQLGSDLKLPEWLEPQRAAIEDRLVPLA
jgi:glyoxalase family protein